jgi:LacI family transcriptional regulator
MEAGYDAGMVEQHTVMEEVPLEDPAYWSEDKAWLPGFVTGEKLLKKIELPASILCVNDNTARGVYRAAEEQSLSVGKDVAVVGIDDIPLAQRLKPGLTTINSPKEEVGYEAARLLHGLIRNPGRPVAHVRLPVELIIRESA